MSNSLINLHLKTYMYYVLSVKFKRLTGSPAFASPEHKASLKRGMVQRRTVLSTRPLLFTVNVFQSPVSLGIVQ